MTCPDFTEKLYELMNWDSKCRYKILGYKIEFEGETYYVFDLIVKETFIEKPKKGEAIDGNVDYNKGYYSEDIAGTFGVDMVRFIYQTCGWEKNSTYRIRGIAVPERNMVVFDLLYEVSHE